MIRLLAAQLATVLLLVVTSDPVRAQEPVFDPGATAQCLNAADDFSARRDCIGASANACMETDGGYTTVGIGYCIQREVEFWDARLNAGYGALMAREKADDAEMVEIGASAPKKADALRDMQRAWIPYRDATCAYEYAQWGGGTGGGPAHGACMMQLTGEQALDLEARMEDPQ